MWLFSVSVIFFYYYFDILGNEHQVLLPDYPLAAF